jgi:hypothetical protein
VKCFLLFLLCISYKSYAQKKIIHIDGAVLCYTDKELIHPTAFELHDTMTVTKYNTEYWSGSYKGQTVYIGEEYLTEIHEEIEKAKKEKLKSDSVIKRDLMIKKYGLKLGVFISKGYIKVGMTKSMAKDAWGEPQEIHRTIFATHSHEQWVYRGGNYLYFDNGLLSAWQD